MNRTPYRRLAALAVAACATGWALTLSPAAAQNTPAPDPQPTTTMQAPDPASRPMTDTPTPSTRPDASTSPPPSTTVSSPPIPDSVENRKLYGGPDSAGGRATAPHPGPVMKHARKTATDTDPNPKP